KEEAVGFLKYLLKVCHMCGPKAQILYDIDFKDPAEEITLDHLEGYRQSRPVRIGNNAYMQLQLDVFGEVLDAVSNFIDIGGYIGRQDWTLLKSFVNAACDLWRQPDNGIWEVRGGPYHFVHSKMMCWVAVDRGIKLAERTGYEGDIERWQQTAADIREEILTRGWDPEQKAFTQHYDTGTLDASNLLMSLYGFLAVTDEKMLSTIEATIEKLGRNGLLHRYLTDETDDGLTGTEGMFLWCSFWLVRNLIRLNRLDEAESLYEK
ncbi:MAG: glycoside hydrolase family 15 protein, partial [Dehalococcoidales bacterium]